MADNTQVSDNPIIAADEVGGVQYQRTKVVWGADGTVDDVSASKPLPVELSDGTYAISLVNTSGTYDGVPVVMIDNDGNSLSFAAPSSPYVEPTLDTAAYAVGDSMDTTVLTFTEATAVAGGSGHILRMTVIDDDDQGQDMKVHFFSASVSPATENTAHSLSDANAEKYIGTISTTDGTWQDHVNNQTVTVTPTPPLPYKVDAGTSLFGVLVSEGTGTYTAAGVRIVLQILKD